MAVPSVRLSLLISSLQVRICTKPDSYGHQAPLNCVCRHLLSLLVSVTMSSPPPLIPRMETLAAAFPARPGATAAVLAFCQVHLALQCVPGWRTADTNAGEVIAAPVLANLTVNSSAPTWMSAEPFHRISKCTIFRTFRELKLAGSFPARFLTSFLPAVTVHGADASASAGSSNIVF